MRYSVYTWNQSLHAFRSDQLFTALSTVEKTSVWTIAFPLLPVKTGSDVILHGKCSFFPCRAFQRFAGVFESRVWLFVGNTLFWHCFILQIVQNNIFVFPAVYKFLKNETMTTLEINLLWLDFRTSLHWQFWGTYLSGDVPVVTLDLMHTYYGNVTITVVLMYSNLKCSNTSLQQVKIWR